VVGAQVRVAGAAGGGHVFDLVLASYIDTGAKTTVSQYVVGPEAARTVQVLQKPFPSTSRQPQDPFRGGEISHDSATSDRAASFIGWHGSTHPFARPWASGGAQWSATDGRCRSTGSVG